MNTENNRSGFQFSNPMLQESIFIINPQYSGKLADVSDTSYKVQVQISDAEATKDTMMEATVSETVTTSEEMNLDEDTPFYVRITMSARFRWNTEAYPNEKEYVNLLKINGASLLLSYIRTNLTELTQFSPIQTQYIPFLDFTKNPIIEDNNER